MRVPILYEDDDLVVIDKPAGMPTHTSDPNDPYPGDALRVVQAQMGLPYLAMHQRLDAETSGVLLFAARREANAALAAAFGATGARSVRKVYLALVHGVPRREAGTVDAPIVREAGERYRVTAAGDRRGQPALTRYRVLETDPRGRYSLLEVIPETGRSHQIRLHLAHLGVPVVGDPLYGRASLARRGQRAAVGPGRAHLAGQAPGEYDAPRLCLHAYRLTLPHPGTADLVTFVAPMPALFGQVHDGMPGLDVRLPPLWWAAPGRSAGADRDLQDLLALAVARRAPIIADSETTIYRLANAVADGLPGLTVDRYGPALVVSVYDRPEESASAAASSDPLPPLAPSLVDALVGASGGASLYVRYRPRQASRVSDDEMAALAPGEPLAGAALGEYVAREEGLAYLMRPGEGWNAGLFPDMREMRTRVRAWAGGLQVLNCFAYTCGFGVAATAGGAGRVLNLDVSKAVLERGRANYAANGFAADPHDFVYGDAFDWLARLARRGDLFDLVILDPPGFARTKTRRFVAQHDYGALAGLAAAAAAPGARLVACCNVADWPWRAFRDRVLAGLAAAGRAAEVIGVYHAPAIDFPTLPGQESHLKILVARLA